MRRKQPPKPDDPKQSERFIEAARKAEGDESGREFERAMGKILRGRRTAESLKPATKKRS
jgi:hypothetical protein